MHRNSSRLSMLMKLFWDSSYKWVKYNSPSLCKDWYFCSFIPWIYEDIFASRVAVSGVWYIIFPLLYPFSDWIYSNTDALRSLSMVSASYIIVVKVLSFWQRRAVKTSSEYLLLNWEMTARAARAMSLSLFVLVVMCWHIILIIEETFLLLFELVE